ncbi:thiamine pyrophosphate-dependent enzyme, partial [Rhizobium ruizarguesonis]
QRNLCVEDRSIFHCIPGGECGFIGPAATGVSLAKQDKQRLMVFAGDGGFQMTAQCLSTQTRFNLNPIIFVMDKGIYGVEQWLA